MRPCDIVIQRHVNLAMARGNGLCKLDIGLQVMLQILLPRFQFAAFKNHRVLGQQVSRCIDRARLKCLVKSVYDGLDRRGVVSLSVGSRCCAQQQGGAGNCTQSI